MRRFQSMQFGVLLVFLWFAHVQGTPRYYGTYQNFGTGDTIVATLQAEGGPNIWRLRWNIECLDGEAMWGVQDILSDFQIRSLQRFTFLWCKFMFPYKPPSNGLYPYYPSCHTRNLTTEHLCYTPRDNADSLNSFVTGVWDDDWFFRVDRLRDDLSTSYKCCKTPTGYYIDYTSCLYKSFHDEFWEYYDATVFVVICDTGYVMTGISKKIHPTVKEYYLEWIQCCRLGFAAGPVKSQPALVPLLPASARLLGRSLEDFDEKNVTYPKSYYSSKQTALPVGVKDYTHLYMPRYVKGNVTIDMLTENWKNRTLTKELFKRRKRCPNNGAERCS